MNAKRAAIPATWFGLYGMPAPNAKLLAAIDHPPLVSKGDKLPRCIHLNGPYNRTMLSSKMKAKIGLG